MSTPSSKPSYCREVVGPGAPQDGTCGMCRGAVVRTRGQAQICPLCDGTIGAPPEPPLRT